MTPLFYKLLAAACVLAVGGTAFNAYVLPRYAPVACITQAENDDYGKAWGRDRHRENGFLRLMPQ